MPNVQQILLDAAVDGNDLDKNIAGHGCISSIWAAVKPIMAAHHYASQDQVSSEGQEHFVQACNEAFADLAQRLASRETNSHSWQQLTKQACRVRAHGSDSDGEDGSFEARQASPAYRLCKGQQSACWLSTCLTCRRHHCVHGDTSKQLCCTITQSLLAATRQSNVLAQLTSQTQGDGVFNSLQLV